MLHASDGLCARSLCFLTLTAVSAGCLTLTHCSPTAVSAGCLTLT